MAAQIFGEDNVFQGDGTRRWEYCRLQVDVNNIRQSDELLKQLGQAGWELGPAVECKDSYIHLWLKREVR
jgi:hypothetical protein